ncbi:hypothetical protein T10_4674 [Trichinella papuae]|uniref:Uncharacterized protein n=1 Tax=Trichinella papuae TaxID=268474 RepID=A0A0V1MLS1_9BILA|nr:hypothetical protein T10_4674 [Trichinella papuae]
MCEQLMVFEIFIPNHTLNRGGVCIVINSLRSELRIIKWAWKDICSLDRWSSKAIVVGKEARPTKSRQCQFHC